MAGAKGTGARKPRKTRTRAGRKPKPPQLKLIEGNPGKRPVPDAPQAPPIAPRKPKWTELVPGRTSSETRVRKDADTEWQRIVPVLDSLGLLSTIDHAILTDYCVVWARIQQGERLISHQGFTTTSEKGALAKHPVVTVLNQYRTQLRFYLGELGLSPSSRGRLELPTGTGESGADDLLD